eukprot:ANDGO_00374.mRNA.1 SPX and EXS domain-containing protein 5
MRFAKYLENHLIPEWKSQYVSYKELKKLISRLLMEKSGDASSEVSQSTTFVSLLGNHGDEILDDTFKVINARRRNETTSDAFAASAIHHSESREDLAHNHEDRVFLASISKEIQKVSAFYEQQLVTLHSNITVMEDMLLKWPGGKQRPRELEANLRLACLEFYRDLEMLRNFAVMNATGFLKISKKYDKVLCSTIWPTVKSMLRNTPFFDLQAIDMILDELKELYAVNFVGGDLKAASRLLRVSPSSQESSFPSVKDRYALFLSGLLLGGIGVLVLDIIYDVNATFNQGLDWKYNFVWFNVYRAVAFVFAQAASLAVAFYFFTEFQINYVFIFDLNPRDHLSPSRYLYLCLCFGAVIFSSMFAYVKSVSYEQHGSHLLLPSSYQPLVACAVLLFCLLSPWPRFFWTSRRWLLSAVLRLLCSPFLTVHFPEFFIADQLSSLSYFLGDLQYAFCIRAAASGLTDSLLVCDGLSVSLTYLLSMIPSYVRLMQCFRRSYDKKKIHPYLSNSVKFVLSLAMLSIAFAESFSWGTSWNAWRTVWILLNVLSTVVRLYWDFVEDWRILPWAAVRERNCFRSRLFHPFAVLVNIVCRVSWALVFLVDLRTFGVWTMFLILGVFEVFRKAVWNLVRVENEHVNNVGKFRAFKEVPLHIHMENPDSGAALHRALLTDPAMEDHEESRHPDHGVSLPGTDKNPSEQTAGNLGHVQSTLMFSSIRAIENDVDDDEDDDD